MEGAMKTFELEKPRGFSLAAAADFFAGFTPGCGMAAAAVDRLTLAFRLDRTFEAVAVVLGEVNGRLVAEYVGTMDGTTLSRQVARMLGLDGDADAWRKIGERDPGVGRLQREFPGFFTAAKSSPYDAAAWGVISPRMQMSAAAKLKIAISEHHGEVVTLGERAFPVFPSPEQMLAIESFPGLSSEKLVRLRGVAKAALAGKLDVEYLRALSTADALAELQTLRGVGPWTAGHILTRGAATPDALPLTEPRVLHGFASAYGITSPSTATFERSSEAWRPYRMWVCVLLARHLGRVGGWDTAGLREERAAAGRRSTSDSERTRLAS
jgi:DNA-3-methyladenine glycosylase II